MPCIPLFEDNDGAIQIAKHPISNSNSKHIDVRYHFLKELLERKEIEIIHVASQYQHSDFLTKALPEREFGLHFHGLTSYEQLNSFGAKRQKKMDPGFDSQG